MQWPRLRKGRGDDAERKTKTNKEEEKKKRRSRREAESIVERGRVRKSAPSMECFFAISRPHYREEKWPEGVSDLGKRRLVEISRSA